MFGIQTTDDSLACDDKTTYNIAFNFLLENEGGFSFHASDSGGPTKYGITQTYLRQVQWQVGPTSNGILTLFNIGKNDDINEQTIKNIKLRQADQFYYQFWWCRYGFDQLTDEKIAIKVFDMSVNIGPKRAIQILQSTINRHVKRGVLTDGKIGPETVKALRKAKLIKTIMLTTCDIAK